MELINKTSQPQQIELVDGTVKTCKPKESIIIKPGTVRNFEFDRALKFFKIKEDKPKVVQSQPITVSEPKPTLNKSKDEAVK